MIVVGDDALEGDGVKNVMLELRFTVVDPLLAHVAGPVNTSLLCRHFKSQRQSYLQSAVRDDGVPGGYGIDMSIAFANPSSDNLVCYLHIPLHIAHFRPVEKESKEVKMPSRYVLTCRNQDRMRLLICVKGLEEHVKLNLEGRVKAEHRNMSPM
jgi:hypothetical protein